MTDRELLEAAARAAGIVVGYVDELGVLPANTREDGPRRGTWNPLEDDGDALRLAVKLQFPLVKFGHGYTDVLYLDTETHKSGICEAYLDTTPEAATRRAIVRAAAAMAPKTTAEAS